MGVPCADPGGCGDCGGDMSAEILARLKSVKTMPELDAMRLDVVNAMTSAGKEGGSPAFYHVQTAFIKAQNRLRRIPLKDRTW